MNICLGLVLVGSKTLAIAFLVTIFWILTKNKIQIHIIAASFEIDLIVKNHSAEFECKVIIPTSGATCC